MSTGGDCARRERGGVRDAGRVGGRACAPCIEALWEPSDTWALGRIFESSGIGEPGHISALWGIEVLGRTWVPARIFGFWGKRLICRISQI